MEQYLNTINLSDNLDFLKGLPDNSIDAVITDSPYGLGKEPKAHEVLFNWISDGYHEVKGKGFMGKKWDAFVPQPVLWKECYRVLKPGGYCLSFFGTRTYDWGVMAMRLAGFEVRDQIDWIYGSGFPKSKATLKPAHEPIAVCRKPGPLQLLNIDECRIDNGSQPRLKTFGERPSTLHAYGQYEKRVDNWEPNTNGRWPTNVIFNEESAIELDEQSGVSGGDKRNVKIAHQPPGLNGIYGSFNGTDTTPCYNDIGGASRFFYVAKASPSERAGMTHPTIKPVKLMTHLVKLFCPIGGVVLDPHFGSGPTGEACLDSGRYYIGIDNDPVSVEEANGRIARWHEKQPKIKPDLFNIAS